MKLHISDKVTIADLQKEFNSEFPFLKIEFFDIPHTKSARMSRSHMYPANRTLGSCRKKHNEGIIEITADDSVEKLESLLWNEFGLSSEVFRKTGNLWIETSLSNSWTLRLQNDEGKVFSMPRIKGESEEDEDIMDRDKWE
jgi:hypothetical protein